jgi:3-oxoacyl-[acyl-carrier-protein] synthase II
MVTQTLRRVVITGMGVISPLGETVDDLWAAVVAGKSGIGPVTLIPPEKRTCRIAGECSAFVPERYMDKKESRRMDRYTQFGMAASRLAYDMSGLTPADFDPNRFSSIVSSAAGGIGTIEEQLMQSLEKGFHKCSPFLVPMMIANMASGRVSIAFNAKGPSRAVVTACSTGADSIGDAFRMIQVGEIDLALAGGAEAPITPLSMAGFTSCRAMSTRYDDPQGASRPFDQGRDGFVMSEGAAVLVMESLDSAQARGAKIYGEIVGYGRTSDAYDVVSPSECGEGAARAMALALSDAQVTPEQVDYVNAHATSTPLGDIAETMAIKQIFGTHATSGKLVLSGTKSMTGHLLGAAGSIEAIISLMTLQTKMVAPTINVVNPDPQCDLNVTPNKAVTLAHCEYALSNSFGFGGHNASLLFKAYTA